MPKVRAYVQRFDSYAQNQKLIIMGSMKQIYLVSSFISIYKTEKSFHCFKDKVSMVSLDLGQIIWVIEVELEMQKRRT